MPFCRRRVSDKSILRPRSLASIVSMAAGLLWFSPSSLLTSRGRASVASKLRIPVARHLVFAADAQVWNEESDDAEAAHAGECAGWRLLRHLRVRCGLRTRFTWPCCLCHLVSMVAESLCWSFLPRCLRTLPRSWARERPRTRSWPTRSSSSGRGSASGKGCLVWSGVRFSARQVMAYYPLHFVVSAIFAPMFIQVERQDVRIKR